MAKDLTAKQIDILRDLADAPRRYMHVDAPIGGMMTAGLLDLVSENGKIKYAVTPAGRERLRQIEEADRAEV